MGAQGKSVGCRQHIQDQYASKTVAGMRKGTKYHLERIYTPRYTDELVSKLRSHDGKDDFKQIGSIHVYTSTSNRQGVFFLHLLVENISLPVDAYVDGDAYSGQVIEKMTKDRLRCTKLLSPWVCTAEDILKGAGVELPANDKPGKLTPAESVEVAGLKPHPELMALFFGRVPADELSIFGAQSVEYREHKKKSVELQYRERDNCTSVEYVAVAFPDGMYLYSRDMLYRVDVGSKAVLLRTPSDGGRPEAQACTVKAFQLKEIALEDDASAPHSRCPSIRPRTACG